MATCPVLAVPCLMKAIVMVGRLLTCAGALLFMLVPRGALASLDANMVESMPAGPPVIIVELTSSQWPMPRSEIADLAALALESGAIAVGVDIAMSTPKNDREDAVLASLVATKPRVVPLLFRGHGKNTNPEGFAFGADGKLLGLECDSVEPSDNDAFAVRLAIAAGQSRDDIHRHCFNGVLQPSTWISDVPVTVIPASKVSNKTLGAGLRGAVVILGTADSMVGTPTTVGVMPTSYINAYLVRCALNSAWKRSFGRR